MFYSHNKHVLLLGCWYWFSQSNSGYLFKVCTISADLTCNLVSVSQLISTVKCTTKFIVDSCIFQLRGRRLTVLIFVLVCTFSGCTIFPRLDHQVFLPHCFLLLVPFFIPIKIVICYYDIIKLFVSIKVISLSFQS